MAMEHEDLTRRIIGCAMRVHGALGPGFLESVYQNALAHEMRKAGLCVECEKRLQVTYDSVVVGDFSADMVVIPSQARIEQVTVGSVAGPYVVLTPDCTVKAIRAGYVVAVHESCR